MERIDPTPLTQPEPEVPGSYDAWLDQLDEAMAEVAAEEAAREAARLAAQREADRAAGVHLRGVLTKLGFDPGELETGEYIAPDGVRYSCSPSGYVLLIGAGLDTQTVELLLSHLYTAAKRNFAIRVAIAVERERIAKARDLKSFRQSMAAQS